nr:hypothetical protein BaRGS_000659 [Batillaria attramentaria]
MNAGMGTSPSTGGLMNMMSNMMSGASSQGGSLPVGAASPSSTGGMSSFFGSMFGGAGAGAGAGSGAAAGPEPGIEMCSSILPMLLANAGVEGPLGSPEAMEMMADVRKQMLPMQCQEFPMMNFRMCCPGTEVDFVCHLKYS